MRTDITRDFAGAAEKGLKVFYNDNLGQFEVETPDEIVSWEDKMNEAGDESEGKAEKQVREFIRKY